MVLLSHWYWGGGGQWPQYTVQGTSRPVTVGQTDTHAGEGGDRAVYVQMPEDAR